MNEDKAPADYRFLIRDVAEGTGLGDSLANVNTIPLPNGACCFVNEDQSIWSLDKMSTRSPATGSVIAPASGPGRWLLLVANQSAAPTIQVYTTNYAVFPLTGNWAASTSSVFTLERPATTQWTLDIAGGELTYHGPDAQFLVEVTASFRVTDASSPRGIFVTVSYNDDMSGTPVTGQDMETTSFTGGDRIAIATQRLVEMSADDTLQIKAYSSPSSVELAGAVRYAVSLA